MKLNIQRFASGTIDGTSTASNATCKIIWSSTPNEDENYSTVYAEVQLYRSGSSSTTGTFTGVININDVEYTISRKFSPYRWGEWAIVGTATAVVPHNADGNKTTNISTYFYNNGTSMAGDYSTPYPNYVTLDTIPRNSQFIPTSWDRDTQRLLTSTLSFPAVQNVSGVYHKLQARFMNNGTETTICTRTGVNIVDGHISFSFSNGELSTIYNLMPNETTHYIRMYLYTYTDSGYTQQLGDVSILWWTGLIPTSVVPTASLTYTEGGDVPNSWNVWVKGKSKINYTLTGTGVYGSTITGYSLSGDGNTYNTNTGLTNYLSSAGSIQFTGSVTDTRQRIGTTTQTFNVLDYYIPSFTATQVQRCDANGNIDDNGSYLYYNFAGSISSCGGNNKANAVYKIGYRVQNTGSYTYVTIDSNKDSINASGVLSGITFSPTTTYDIQFLIIDTFNPNGIPNLQTLGTGFDLMNFNAAGTSMAIGKVSQRTASEKVLDIALEVALSTNAKNSLLDYIYPVGSIYMSVNNTSPASFLGGTWVALEDRFLIGASANYSGTGGSATIDLSHNHTYGFRTRGWYGTLAETFDLWENNSTWKSNETDTPPNNITTRGGTDTGNNSAQYLEQKATTESKLSSTQSIMPPYLAVYMWKRTN